MRTRYEIGGEITNYCNGLKVEPMFLSTRPLRELFAKAEKTIEKAYEEAEDWCEKRDVEAAKAGYVIEIGLELDSVTNDIKDILMHSGLTDEEADFAAEDILNAIGERNG